MLLYFTESFVPRIYTLKRLNTHWTGCFAAALPENHIISMLSTTQNTVSHTDCTLLHLLVDLKGNGFEDSWKL